MFSCRLMQEHKDKAFEQLTAQVSEACKIEDDLARGAAEIEDEYQIKNRERSKKKKKAAIEFIAEHRATLKKLELGGSIIVGKWKRREEKAEHEEDCNQWITADCIYLEMEKAKKQRQHDANMEVQKIQIQQMVNRKNSKRSMHLNP
ncbi:hypothetical protein QYF61_016509 [Mycteria americana]|uniref:Uncharacterized protein n=1 Tax=Mycteria americana TaxID=33587 RepID=A0AAN7RUG2_MYCAM|nr:hypothetical protein QYF61_016509 [Mycteria americana]